MTKEEALILLTEIDKVRISAEARPNDYNGEFALRVAQALIAKAAGFESRSTWERQLDKEALQAQRDAELDKKLDRERQRNARMENYGKAAKTEAIFASIKAAQDLENNLRKRNSAGMGWQECDQILKEHIWHMQAIRTKFN